MKIEPYSTRWAAVVTRWLSDENNLKWIKLGTESQKIDPVTFRIMSQRPQHDFHIYFHEDTGQPIGLVAFSEIDHTSKTATLWYMLGEKEFAGKGYTTKAVNELLRYGFYELGIRSVYAWAVKDNVASVKILEKNHFNYIGRRRQCHPVDGVLRDRLLYDLLSEEFLELNYEKYRDHLQYKDQDKATHSGRVNRERVGADTPVE